jgi:hypothetical protein
MLIYEIHISETASSGAWSKNTAKFDNVKIKQIIIKANTATTTFAFSITDWKGNVIFNTETKPTGTLRQEVNIPVKGICTLAVSSASSDEAFTGKIVIQEEP